MQPYEHYTKPSPCNYLPKEKASFHYLYIQDCHSTTYQLLLERGYRRFGKSFFRHNCPNCQKCQSIRIPLETFKPTKSQRRVLKSNQDIHITISRPQVSEEHLRIYNEYHKQRAIDRKWHFEPFDFEDYIESYVEGSYKLGWEFQYRRNNELLGVGLVDEVIDSFSSVYFYYATSWAKNSPGVFSILKEIEYAKAAGKKYLHLGYWVKENQSLSYKSNYGPHEILQERTPLQQKPNWQLHQQED